jgi:hypothetical protein
MDVNDTACILNERIGRTFFASKLAPTGSCGVRYHGVFLLKIDCHD